MFRFHSIRSIMSLQHDLAAIVAAVIHTNHPLTYSKLFKGSIPFSTVLTIFREEKLNHSTRTIKLDRNMRSKKVYGFKISQT
ncbi:Hypothetical predicted protein [Octopus vulgaris]|uniref:Uncharacterized protein n=1 Tax=Octopus vulgaris TaxID=6645 RepID=A0AA36AYK0_OCTVU|nr:Hypothetical predicted protein [Octopus vulgaris]